jgi:hypothetical protein
MGLETYLHLQHNFSRNCMLQCAIFRPRVHVCLRAFQRGRLSLSTPLPLLPQVTRMSEWYEVDMAAIAGTMELRNYRLL